VKRALVVWGGADFHEPEKGAEVVRGLLEGEGFEVVVSPDYTALATAAEYDLVVPQITGGDLDRESSIAFVDAVEEGTGVAAFHYGLATTFHGNMRMRLLAGCTFAGHPGNNGVTYRIDPVKTDDPVMAGIESFEHTSEQYFLHVDPTVEVLATTTFSGEHAFWLKGVVVPQVFKKHHGKGRVFYTALGHVAAELDSPPVRTILTRGMLWAAR
jgi:type 1 glutamine amidotransferase